MARKQANRANRGNVRWEVSTPGDINYNNNYVLFYLRFCIIIIYYYIIIISLFPLYIGEPGSARWG